MWAIYAVAGYFLLALLLPVCWALLPVWRRARKPRHVTCPAMARPALIDLDPWHAAARRVLGGDELRVRHCSQWPAYRNCGQECLDQCGQAV